MDTSRLKFANKEVEKKYKAEWKKDHEMVRGRFGYPDCPGGDLVFPFQKYPDDQLVTYTLRDGKVYELPYMVAKHLATNVYYQVHKRETNSDGTRSTRIGKKIHRTTFQKLDFEDMDLVPANIITVEHTEPEIIF